MVHYTLLPEKQIRSLKKEYRTRLIIFLFFFLSCSILVGVAFLVPAFVLSSLQEKELMSHIDLTKKSKNSIEIVNLVKDLSMNDEMVRKLRDHKEPVIFSGIVQNIINHKPQGLSITSFNISNENNLISTSTIIIAIFQGKSSTREILIKFKNNLESDPLISKVDLPVSDLVKSRDISYSIKVSFIQTI